jgi:hypothetical protein
MQLPWVHHFLTPWRILLKRNCQEQKIRDHGGTTETKPLFFAPKPCLTGVVASNQVTISLKAFQDKWVRLFAAASSTPTLTIKLL